MISDEVVFGLSLLVKSDNVTAVLHLIGFELFFLSKWFEFRTCLLAVTFNKSIT